MKFLMLIKVANSPDYEAGNPPPEQLNSAMGELMEEWSKAGVMLSAAGLRPTSEGTRVRLNGGSVTFLDGPFTEAKEVIGGFFILEVESRAAVMDMTRRFVELHQRVLGDDFQLECELREVEA